MFPIASRIRCLLLVFLVTLGSAGPRFTPPASASESDSLAASTVRLEKLEVLSRIVGEISRRLADGEGPAISAAALGRAQIDAFSPPGARTVAELGGFEERPGIPSPPRWHGKSDEQADGTRTGEGSIQHSTGSTSECRRPLEILGSLRGSRDGNGAAGSLTNAGRTVKMTYQSDGNGDGSFDGRGGLTSFYDARGLPTHLLGDVDYDNDGVFDYHMEISISYDARGNRAAITYTTEQDASQWIERDHFSYDEHDRVMRISRELESYFDGNLLGRSASSDDYFYDTRGNLLRHVEEVDFEDDGLANFRTTHVFVYDIHRNLTRGVVSYDSDANGLAESVYTETAEYDGRGNPVLVTYEAEVTGDGRMDYGEIDRYQYDQHDNPVFATLEQDWDGNGTADYRTTIRATFDLHQRLVEAVSEYIGADGSIQRLATLHVDYDVQGRITQQVYQVDDPPLGSPDGRVTETFQYDSRDNATRYELTSDYDNDGIAEASTISESTFDTQGRLIAQDYRLAFSTSPGYRVMSTYEYDGSGAPPQTSAATEGGLPDARLALESSNPFRDRLTLGYVLAQRAHVELSIYDIRGRLVRTLARGLQEVGQHRAEWDGRDEAGRSVPSAVYFARLEAGDRVHTKMLMRAW